MTLDRCPTAALPDALGGQCPPVDPQLALTTCRAPASRTRCVVPSGHVNSSSSRPVAMQDLDLAVVPRPAGEGLHCHNDMQPPPCRVTSRALLAVDTRQNWVMAIYSEDGQLSVMVRLISEVSHLSLPLLPSPASTVTSPLAPTSRRHVATAAPRPPDRPR
jgi:hypothetical protein